MNPRPILFVLLLAACGGDDATARPAADPGPDERADSALAIDPAGAPGAMDSAAVATAEDAAPPAAETMAPRGTADDAAPRPSSPPAPAPGGQGDAPAAGAVRPAAGSSTARPDDAAPASRQEVEEILRATAARYEDVRSLQADFRQVLTNTLLGRTTRSAGTLYQRQPDRFLMEFSDPAGDVIVSDGEFFWIYYPSVDAKQVIRSGRGAGGLDLRSQFVGDPVRRFEATSHGSESVDGRATHVLTLTPREPVGYRRLKVWIDAEDHLVRRFELTEENGNVRRFDLIDLRINPSLPDDLFRFTPPAGAVVVSR